MTLDHAAPQPVERSHGMRTVFPMRTTLSGAFAPVSASSSRFVALTGTT